MKRVSRAILEYVNFTLREVVYVIILIAVFAFVSFLGYRRAELYPDPAYSRYNLVLVHYGFPFESVQLTCQRQFCFNAQICIVMLILDFAAYFLLAFVIVLGYTKIDEYMTLRRRKEG